MKNIAIFASGSGSNAENISKYFNNNEEIKVNLILTNNPNAGVIERAGKYDINIIIFNKDQFYNSETILDSLINNKIDLIVLAGFLWLVPQNIIKAFPNKIINIHPALLPKYGGKGMYGMNVHKAIIKNQEKESGITIHIVNELYDEGQLIFQAKCKITNDETPESLAQKVHVLEHKHFPIVIDTFLSKNQ